MGQAWSRLFFLSPCLGPHMWAFLPTLTSMKEIKYSRLFIRLWWEEVEYWAWFSLSRLFIPLRWKKIIFIEWILEQNYIEDEYSPLFPQLKWMKLSILSYLSNFGKRRIFAEHWPWFNWSRVFSTSYLTMI